MKISYPSFSDYQAVLQSPVHCFAIPELKTFLVETDLWGLPRVRSGGFALTYKLTKNNRSIAVRCFHRYIQDRSLRYAAIGNYLAANPSDVFVPIRYSANGILVRGKWYPITYMPWVEGDTLEAFVVKNLNNRELMHHLTTEFAHVVSELERLGVSHGDLSHRNIMVRNKKLVLVDYDGMYVPGIPGKKSCEIGNPHFQLPGRTDRHFDAGLDRFSELVIYLALEALARNPTMWERYETGGEGFLFTRNDFINPYQSTLLQEMETLPGLGPLVGAFRHICTSEMTRVPRLSDFVEARPLDLTRTETPIGSPQVSPVHDASYRIGLLVRVGKMLTVVGKVEEVFRGTSKGGEPHVFLNFGNWRSKCFTIVLWNDALQLLDAAGKSPDVFLGRWVRVTGIVTSYERRPQIAVFAPTDIHLLENEEVARNLLARNKKSGTPPVSATTRPAGPGTADPGQPTQKAIQPPVPSLRTGGLNPSSEVYARIDKLYSKG